MQANSYRFATISRQFSENEAKLEVVAVLVEANASLGAERDGPPQRAPRVAARTVTGCGRLYRDRSRLYRSQILQVNMRWKALAEIYKMHSFAPFSWFSWDPSKLNFLIENR